jgi:RNA polymerase sigma factor (sigma-70 family)
MRLAQDRELLERFRAGDPQAMAAVFEIYSEPLARFLAGGFAFDSGGQKSFFHGVGQLSDLHDLVAETFRRAFEPAARSDYGGAVPYGAYLRAIARNLVLDRLRSPGGRWSSLDERVAAVGPDAAVAEPAPRAPEDSGAPELAFTPEQRYQQAELTRLVDEFRGELSGAERRFLALRYEEGLSQAELATRLGRTRRWVRTTEAELRTRLLAHLRGTGYLPPGQR